MTYKIGYRKWLHLWFEIKRQAAEWGFAFDLVDKSLSNKSADQYVIGIKHTETGTQLHDLIICAECLEAEPGYLAWEILNNIRKAWCQEKGND